MFLFNQTIYPKLSDLGLNIFFVFTFLFLINAIHLSLLNNAVRVVIICVDRRTIQPKFLAVHFIPGENERKYSLSIFVSDQL